MTDSTAVEHLRTKYVFIDTEAFRRDQFDWTGRTLSKLVALAKQGHLRLLTTEVVKGEVRSQLREMLGYAVASMKKHENVLKQVGAIEALTKVANINNACAALDAAFDSFLKETYSIDVPLYADLKSLFADYFARRPPFSDKKKSEFPDAITIASLLAWCAKKKVTAYVVSRDPDLIACCSDLGPLFHADSVGDIISQATVSKELHEALEKALSDSNELSRALTDQIGGMELVSAHGPSSFQSKEAGVTGRVAGVDDIRIILVNVLSREGKIFTCEIECEASLNLDVNVEVYDYHEPPFMYSVSKTIYHVFYAEVIVAFEQSTSEIIEFESVFVYGKTVELLPRQITELLA